MSVRTFYFIGTRFAVVCILTATIIFGFRAPIAHNIGALIILISFKYKKLNVNQFSPPLVTCKVTYSLRSCRYNFIQGILLNILL